MLGRRPFLGGVDGGAEEVDVVVWMPWVLTSGHTYLVCILSDIEGHAFAATLLWRRRYFALLPGMRDECL